MDPTQTPWQPLYSIERGGLTEVSVSGIIAAVSDHLHVTKNSNELKISSDKPTDNSTKKGEVDLLVGRGDVNYPLWTRSLLKPFQLASHIGILRETYPALTLEHLALMSSSHNCEDVHLDLLQEIITIGKVPADKLQCPQALPGDACTRERYKEQGKQASSLYHNCSAKHFSYMLSLQAQGKPISDYIEFENSEHKGVEKLLSELLNRPSDSFSKTTDGCQLPNHAMSVKEMATIYQKLGCAAEAFLSLGDDCFRAPLSRSHELGFVGALMHRFPYLLGGRNRLDTRIMCGGFEPAPAARFLAKDGADGLLAIAAMPTPESKSGLAIVVKLSSGYEIRHMETIAGQILHLLGIDVKASENAALNGLRTKHLQTNFAFGLSKVAAVDS